jgi:ketosteroid isomerase-like protein
MKSAMAAHDKAAVAAILAPDFTSIDTSGQMETAAQTIAEVDTLPSDPNRTSTTTLISVKRAGDVATVEQRYDMKTKKAGPDGVEHNVELVTLSTDTCVLSGQTWLIQRTVTKELSIYRDGQLAAHKVGP